MKVEAASHEDKTAYFETIYRPSSELDGTDVAPMKSTANPDIMMSRRSTPFHVHQKENKTETQFKASQLKHGTPIIESSRSFFFTFTWLDVLPGFFDRNIQRNGVETSSSASYSASFIFRSRRRSCERRFRTKPSYFSFLNQPSRALWIEIHGIHLT